MTFCEELIVTIVDKAAIGLLILGTGFFANRLLEQFKSELALRNDSAKNEQALRNELKKLRDAKQLDYMERQLTNFYWPIYIRLQIDDAVWERILDKQEGKDELRQKVGHKIESEFLLPNHEEIIKIIESNIHLMDGNSPLFEEMKKYIRHVTVYRAMRSAGCVDQDPIMLGEPWPEDFSRLLVEATYQVQAKYDGLLAQI